VAFRLLSPQRQVEPRANNFRVRTSSSPLKHKLWGALCTCTYYYLEPRRFMRGVFAQGLYFEYAQRFPYMLVSRV
jgi:hypothetical protein